MTVVSVGPYVFTILRPDLVQRATSHSGHVSPPRMIRRRSDTSFSSIVKRRVGTHERTVIWLSFRNREKSGPARVIPCPAGTKVAPA